MQQRNVVLILAGVAVLVVVAIIVVVVVVVVVVGSRKTVAGPFPSTSPKSSTPTPTATGLQYKNPVLVNVPDPCIVFDEGDDAYWAFGTHPGRGYTAFTSPDLKTWKPADTLALEGGGKNGEGNFWAPECFKRKADDTRYLTYTADQRMYIARSTTTSARGPYVHHAGPLRSEWGIDSHYFRDPVDDKEYLFFATGAGIHVGELRDNLRSLIDVRFVFGNDSHPENWVTSKVNEAPWCMHKDGTYYLVYSGNGTGPSYAVGFATASKVAGPYVKSRTNPILSAPGTGPGHCCFFETRGGQLMIGYHRHIGAPAGRNMCVDVVSHFGDGRIEIDGPTDGLRLLPA